MGCELGLGVAVLGKRKKAAADEISVTAMRLIGLSGFVALVVAGCGIGTQVRSTFEVVGSTACELAFADAAAVGDMEDTVEDLDPAVRACTSLEEWGAANAANPAALDGVDPFEFLGNRCDVGDGLSATNLCGALLAACGEAPYADTTYCLAR